MQTVNDITKRLHNLVHDDAYFLAEMLSKRQEAMIKDAITGCTEYFITNMDENRYRRLSDYLKNVGKNDVTYGKFITKSKIVDQLDSSTLKISHIPVYELWFILS